MKRMTILMALLCMFSALPTIAQPRYPGRPHNPGFSRSTPPRSRSFLPNTYLGMRFGMTASHVNSDAPALNGSKSKTGLNVGLVGGVQLAPYTPLFFETGLTYVEKGGKGNLNGEKFTIGLNYIEVPLLLKYSAYVAPATAVEPFIGGYLSGGISGKVKDYGAQKAYSSYSDTYGANFKRFDGGIRVGCGLAYEMLYLEMGYDFGLSNIGDNAFDDTHNGTFFANIGLNF